MHRLFIFVFCIFCVGAQAQTNTAPTSNTLDAYWSFNPSPTPSQAVLAISTTVIPDPVPGATTVMLQQNGLGNQANLQTVAGTQSRLDVTQMNDGNVVNAVLSGFNNSVILSQTGGGNTINFGLSGTNNRFMLTQDGGDAATMVGLQKDNTRIELLQGSGNNSFTMDNSNLFIDPLSKGIPNLRIEQTGGASAIIQQGHIIGN